jgi:rod shape-determining protein MreD
VRNLYIAISMLIAVHLDSVFFNTFNISGARPDAMLVVVVSLGVLMGGLPASLIGLAGGLFMDVMFNKPMGLAAMSYMLAGALGGILYKKYYADNVILPAVVVAGAALLKEHIMALALKVSGGTYLYFDMLFSYIVPSVLLSAALSMVVHAFLKRAFSRQVGRRAEHRL